MAQPTSSCATLLRVKPGTRVRARRRSIPDATLGHDKASAAAADARPVERLRRPPGPALGRGEASRSWSSSRGSTRPARTARSSKVMEAFNPQGCPVTSFKVPTAGGARPRLPVAGPPAHAAARARSGSSIGRTTRTSSSSASTASSRKRSGRSATTRSTSSSEMLADERHDDRQVLPVDRSRRAAQAVPGALRRSDEALEVPHGRPRRAQALGRLPGRLRRGPDARPRPRGRRGTSSRPTASGSATWRSRRSWPTRSPACGRRIRGRPDLPPNLVIE